GIRSEDHKRDDALCSRGYASSSRDAPSSTPKALCLFLAAGHRQMHLLVQASATQLRTGSGRSQLEAGRFPVREVPSKHNHTIVPGIRACSSAYEEILPCLLQPGRGRFLLSSASQVHWHMSCQNREFLPS